MMTLVEIIQAIARRRSFTCSGRSPDNKSYVAFAREGRRTTMSKRDEFIRVLAEYLVGNQVEMSIKLQMKNPEGIRWAAMRGLSPLTGYPTVEEATKQLHKFLKDT